MIIWFRTKLILGDSWCLGALVARSIKKFDSFLDSLSKIMHNRFRLNDIKKTVKSN